MLVLSYGARAMAINVHFSSKLTASWKTCLLGYGEICGSVTGSQQVVKLACVMLCSVTPGRFKPQG